MSLLETCNAATLATAAAGPTAGSDESHALHKRDNVPVKHRLSSIQQSFGDTPSHRDVFQVSYIRALHLALSWLPASLPACLPACL